MAIDDVIQTRHEFLSKFVGPDYLALTDIEIMAKEQRLPYLVQYSLERQTEFILAAIIRSRDISVINFLFETLFGEDTGYVVSDSLRQLIADDIAVELIYNPDKTDYLAPIYDELTGQQLPLEEMADFAMKIYLDPPHSVDMPWPEKVPLRFLKYHKMTDHLEEFADHIEVNGKSVGEVEAFVEALESLKVLKRDRRRRVRNMVEDWDDQSSARKILYDLGFLTKKELTKVRLEIELKKAAKFSHEASMCFSSLEKGYRIATENKFNDAIRDIADLVVSYGLKETKIRTKNRSGKSDHYEALIEFAAETGISFTDEQSYSIVRFAPDNNLVLSENTRQSFYDFVVTNLDVVKERMQEDILDWKFVRWFRSQSEDNYMARAAGLCMVVAECYEAKKQAMQTHYIVNHVVEKLNLR